jgi:hypothetical protein
VEYDKDAFVEEERYVDRKLLLLSGDKTASISSKHLDSTLDNSISRSPRF